MAAPLAEPLVQQRERYDWRGWVTPQWMEWIQPEALRIAQNEEDKTPPTKITTFACSGPAIASIWKVTYVQWGFAMLFPFVVCILSSCPPPWEPFAHYPSYVWLFFFPVVGYSVRAEIRALTWIMPTLAAYCAPFKVIVWTTSMSKWLLFIFCLSLATHADLATNGLFLAKILKTVSCHGHKAREIQKIWYYTIEDAHIVSWIPGFNRLDMLLLIGWGLMFLQPVLCLLYARPLAGQDVKYGVNSMPQGYTTPWAWIFAPGQGGRRVLHHADVLQWLGAVNRMVSITDKSLTWMLSRADEIIVTRNDYCRALNMIDREFARITHRLFLVNLLEKAYMLEVQVTIFAISRCLIPRDRPSWMRVDGQMVFSIMLSAFTFMKVIYDSYSQLMAVHRVVNIEVPPEHEESANNEGVVDTATRCKWRIFQTQLGFLLGFVLLCFAMLHSSMKFVMSFVCEDSMWNLHNPFVHTPGEDWRGCVELSTYLSG